MGLLAIAFDNSDSTKAYKLCFSASFDSWSSPISVKPLAWSPWGGFISEHVYGGSWVGITESSRFAALLIPPEMAIPSSNTINLNAREHLINNFLFCTKTCINFVNEVIHHPSFSTLPSFYLILGDSRNVSFYNHGTDKNPVLLNKGIYVIGNSTRNNVTSSAMHLDRLTKSFTSLISPWWINPSGLAEECIDSLLSFVDDSGTFDIAISEGELEPCSGNGLPCDICSNIFIKDHTYKSKDSTSISTLSRKTKMCVAICIDGNSHCCISEKFFDLPAGGFSKAKYTFDLKVPRIDTTSNLSLDPFAFAMAQQKQQQAMLMQSIAPGRGGLDMSFMNLLSSIGGDGGVSSGVGDVGMPSFNSLNNNNNMMMNNNNNNNMMSNNLLSNPMNYGAESSGSSMFAKEADGGDFNRYCCIKYNDVAKVLMSQGPEHMLNIDNVLLQMWNGLTPRERESYSTKRKHSESKEKPPVYNTQSFSKQPFPRPKMTMEDFSGRRGKGRGRGRGNTARLKKHPDAPRRPRSAYMCFVKKNREQVKSDYPDIGFVDIGQKLGELWRGMDEVTKAGYQRESDADKSRYAEEMKAYNLSDFPFHVGVGVNRNLNSSEEIHSDREFLGSSNESINSQYTGTSSLNNSTDFTNRRNNSLSHSFSHSNRSKITLSSNSVGSITGGDLSNGTPSRSDLETMSTSQLGFLIASLRSANTEDNAMNTEPTNEDLETI